MTPQVKPQRWLCMVTAFAMALDLPVADLISEIGHDGSKIAFPHLPEPACRAGHHVQEILPSLLSRGYSATPIEFCPIIRTFGDQVPNLFEMPRTDHSLLNNSIATGRGVLEGWVRRQGHAFAFCQGLIVDPDGGQFDYSTRACLARHFTPRQIWLVQQTSNEPTSQASISQRNN